MQFPFSKGRFIRTVQNVLADGSMFVSPDPTSSQIAWNLRFDELSPADMQALQSFYTACAGPFAAFTFIDPADNMLVSSSDLTNSAWSASPNISLSSGLADPFGGSTGFSLTNTGQIAETIGQTVAVPANYQYCFSVYVRANVDSSVNLTLAGASATSSRSFACGPVWNRIDAPIRLNDSSTSLTAAIQLQPGGMLQLYGPQLEPQSSPSRYRPTSSSSGVYANAHWVSNQLLFSADGPNSFATSFSIESVL